MRIRTALGAATVAVLSTASCQSPVAPEAGQGLRSVSAAVGQQQTGPSNRCYGEYRLGDCLDLALGTSAQGGLSATPRSPGALGAGIRSIAWHLIRARTSNLVLRLVRRGFVRQEFARWL